ncbi:HTH-type transcriptional regulator MalT [compost metagenome]
MALVAEATRIQCLLLAGDVREAERFGTPVLARAIKANGPHSISANLCASLLADAYYELDRIDDARETIANRLGLLHASAPDVMVRASLCRARLDLLQEGPDVAQAFMTQQTAHLRSLGQHRAVANMLAAQVRLHLQLGYTARAAELCATLDDMSLAHRDSRGYLASIPALAALARARLFHVDDPGQALREVDTLRAHGVQYGRGRQVALADLLAAMVLEQTDRPDEAMECFTRALEAGARRGLVRTFLDEGAPAAALLARFVRTRKADEPVLRYARGLLGRMPESEEASAARRRGGPKASVALTQRELEILSLVAQAMSNKRIALTLNITVETVKWNLRNIFAKLGVSSRYHAMVWAREQALIT